MKKRVIAWLVALVTFAAANWVFLPDAQAQRRVVRNGGFNRGWYAIESSRRAKQYGVRPTARNSVAHRMMWGPVGPGFSRTRGR